MISIQQYLFSVGNPQGLLRTLGEIVPCRDARGRILCSAGNSAVVFRIRHAGRLCALRCYTRPARNLGAIYGEKLLQNELFVFRDPQHGEWVDVVLTEWIEGTTLHERIQDADAEEFARLAEAFDALALGMVCDDRAHGDLKPENIVVAPDGDLRLIDLDASFLPQFAGQESSELGTAAFQHPARTTADFDARLDDFPAALISTALHALALDPTLRDRHGVQDTLLIDPHRLPNDPALTEILSLFERHGMAAHYRIARLLRSPSLRLPGLGPLLRFAIAGVQNTPQTPELFPEGGLWGYRDAADGLTVIPPIYDCGFDFTEESAAVQLGRTWHFIDLKGRTTRSFPGAEAVKPFRGGSARVLHSGRWYEIEHEGVPRVLEF